MKDKNLIQKEYPRIRFVERQKKGKTYTCYRVDCRGHGWKGDQRPEFQSKADAIAHAQMVREKIKSFGVSEVPHEDFTLLERLRGKLLPIEVDLETAVDSFVTSYNAEHAIKSTETVQNVAAWYYEDKKNGLHKLEGKGLIGINTTCNWLTKIFGARPIGTITKDDIKKALVENFKPASQGDYLGRFRTFFKWAMGNGYIKDNPCGIKDRGDAIKPPKYKKPEQQILSKDDILNLLGSALNEPKSVPFFALAIFQGMRPEEIKRMWQLHKWNHFYLDERKLIYVPKDVSKTFNHNEPVHDNVLEWLKPYKDEGKSFYVKNHRRIEKRVRKGIKWQKDIMRHTAISYFMGKYDNNLGKVSNWMGNSPDTIMGHYYVPVLPADVEWFWSLTPTIVKKLLDERKKKAVDPK